MSIPATVWLVLLILFVVIEAGTVMLVSVWFAAGALVALIGSLLGAEIWLQGLLFFVVSGLSLWALRPFSKKLLMPRITKTNVDALIGSIGKVTQKIDNDNAQGSVRLGAMDWSARSSDGKIIEVGTRVRVDRIEGVKAVVSPAEVVSMQ